MRAFTVAVLAVVATVATAAVPVPKDPSARLAAVGLNRLPQEPAQLQSELRRQFPLLVDHPKTLAGANASVVSAARVEMTRMVILVDALKQRGLPADAAVLKSMSGGWECETCTWVVNKLKGKISDYGCDAAADAFAAVCAAIPFVDVAIPVCVAVLKWGCGKLLGDLEDHITSSTQLCNDVFGVC